MSEKAWQARNRAHSAEQTPGETKQGRYREGWQERKSGLLVPGLGVAATMIGDIIVTDKRCSTDGCQLAEIPNLDDHSLQHDKGGSRNLGEESSSHRILISSMTVSGLRRRWMWNLASLNSG